MKKKTPIVGIKSQKKMRERVLAIASGKRKPKPGEPRIWLLPAKKAKISTKGKASICKKVQSEANGALSKKYDKLIVQMQGPEFGIAVDKLMNATGEELGKAHGPLRKPK